MSTQRSGRGLALALAAVSLAAPAARADLMYGGEVLASFSNPVLAGFRIGVDQQPVFADNSATAVYSIQNNGAVAVLTSGDNFGGAGGSSVVRFVGANFASVAPDTDFTIGTLTFDNGTSSVGTSIFGATLTVWVKDRPDITPAVIPFRLLTTTNGGVSAALDADYLTFPAPVSVNFHVFEQKGAEAAVYGQIVGDPVFTVTGLQIDPTQAGGGFLTPAVPAPGGVVLLAIGAVCLLARRQPGRSATATMQSLAPAA